MQTSTNSSSLSETYALKWKHVDFEKSQFFIGKVLDKFSNEKNTKGNKTTIFHIPVELKELLLEWKNRQQLELAQFDIKQTHDQLVFTFNDRKRNISQLLHTDVIPSIFLIWLVMSYSSPFLFRFRHFNNNRRTICFFI